VIAAPTERRRRLGALWGAAREPHRAGGFRWRDECSFGRASSHADDGFVPTMVVTEVNRIDKPKNAYAY